MLEADPQNKNADDIVQSDFNAKGVGIAETELRSKMREFLAQVVRDIEAAVKI